MVLASLWFANLDWVIPLLVATAAAAALIGWSYRVGPGGRFRVLCILLKGLGVGALVWCLLEPWWGRQRVRPGANLFAVVADNSLGMRIKDPGEDRRRAEILLGCLSGTDGAWQDVLAEHFTVRRFTFDARLQDTRHGFDLAFDGSTSAIGEALGSIRDRFEGRPLAGVLLLTDGIATDRESALTDLAGLPPVYPVVIGHDAPLLDVAVSRTHVSRTAFEDAPITVQADVAVQGNRAGVVFARLEDASGAVVREQTQTVGRDEVSLTFRFQFRPEAMGVSFYRVRAGIQGEESLTEEETREATLINNHRVVTVDQGQGPYRVLYVSGRPNWEYKFLNRAVAEDDQIQLVALIRIALREPKFEFRGRAGETSNPLFRGFGDQSPEEAERYDQPVLTRLNTRDEIELRGGFPRSAEELYTYHAVILDDVEAGFFEADQALLLQRFASQRGGGVLMLGGMEMFQLGGYLQSPIGDMLPVHLDRDPAEPVAGALSFGLAREGWLQAWARLRDQEGAERVRLEHMPQFQVLNPVQDVKPGASVVATVTDEDGEVYPALVTQRFGRGRTAALMIGDFWRWGSRDPAARDDMEKAWRQFLRWVVSDVPSRVEIQVEDASDSAPGAVRLVLRAQDETFQPLDDAAIDLQVSPMLAADASTTGGVIRLQAEPSMHEAGLYQAEFTPRASGGYQTTAVFTGADGKEIGRAEAGWSTDLEAEEFRSLRPDTAFLDEVARHTQGEVIAPHQVSELVKALPTRGAPVMESWATPLWHTPWVFLLAVACFTAEWGLRRWRGLP